MSSPGIVSVPWRKIGLSAVGIAAFAFFWVNGPLQEPQPVFEFTETVTGYDKPVRVGEEKLPPKFGVIEEQEETLYHAVIAVREAPPQLYSIIGDPRNNPSLAPEVAELVFAGAQDIADNPDGAALKTALDMFYVEQHGPDGDLRELYLENTGLNKRIKGYAGPIDVSMTVGLDGTIQRVTYLRSAETTSYLKDIESAGFYEEFEGIPLDGESYQIDALTGATLTTEAIARSVSSLVSIGRESPLEIYIDTEPAGFVVKAELPATWIIDAALITLIFVLVWIKGIRRSKRLIQGIGILTVLYLGFYLNNSFTYVTFLQPFMGSGWSYMLGIYAGLVLISAIWDGNSYCRYICPYGNVQHLLLKFGPKIRGKLPISTRVGHAIRWLLTAVLIVAIFMGLKDWGSYELFPDLFGMEVLESGWFWLSAGIILISAYYPMLWCRVLCPTGAVLDTIADIARPGKARKKAGTSSLAGIPVTTEPAG
jgi:NosR/NirI family nitrous oxide reductase transcriptional regulator